MVKMKYAGVVTAFLLGAAFIGYSWFAESVIYSDFEWIDEQHFLVLRSHYSAGAAEVVSNDRLLVDIETKKAIPIKGSVNGFAVGQGPSRLFVALNHDILLIDLTSEEPAEAIPVFSTGPCFGIITGLQWVREGVIEVSVATSVFTYIYKVDWWSGGILEESTLDTTSWYMGPKEFLKDSAPGEAAGEWHVINVPWIETDVRDALQRKGYHPFIVPGEDPLIIVGAWEDRDRARTEGAAVSKLVPYAIELKTERFATASYLTDVYFGAGNIWLRDDGTLTPLFDASMNEIPVCRMGDDLYLVRNRKLLAVNLETGEEVTVYPSPRLKMDSQKQEAVELPFGKIWQMAFDFMESFDTAEVPDNTIELPNGSGGALVIVNYYYSRYWGNYVIYRDTEGREDILLEKCSNW